MAGASPVVRTGRDILRLQNEPRSLQLLLAQRRMYSFAKRWSNLRVIGVGVIAIAAPIITALLPGTAEIVGAVAGGWFFLNKTLCLSRERHWIGTAAGVQELFDCHVFRLPRNDALGPAPTPELISDVANQQTAASSPDLRDWYVVPTAAPGDFAVALAQRANAAYSERLLRLYARIWLIGGSVWGAIAVAISLVAELSLAQFLMGIVLPVLPAVVDARDFWYTARGAADDQKHLANHIEVRLRERDRNGTIQISELRAFQDQLYKQRRERTLIPDLLYRLVRRRNEAAMKHAAEELTRLVRPANRRT